MNMNRRTFLGGVLALTAVANVPKALLAAPLPTLYGDGLHDDMAALNALFDGQPFLTADGFAGVAQDAHLINGRFLVSDTLHIRRRDVTLLGCDIESAKGVKMKNAIEIHNGVDGANFKNCYVECPGAECVIYVHAGASEISIHDNHFVTVG